MEEYTGSDGHTFFGEGVKYQKRFQQWWSVARQSEDPPAPYDFLVNMGARPELANDILLKLIEDSCDPERTPSDHPGSVDYMAHHCSKGLDEEKGDDVLYDVLRVDIPTYAPLQPQNAETNLPSERDLLSLVDATTNPRSWFKYIIPFCLVRDFSAKFLQSIFDKVPENSLRVLALSRLPFCKNGNSGFRKALDRDCIRGIQKVLPQVEELKLSGRWESGSWRKDAFLDLLGVVLQTTSVRTLDIDVPNHVVVDENFSGEETDDETQSSLQELLHLDAAVVCGIQNFNFSTKGSCETFAERQDTKAWEEGSRLVLECLSQMPLLQKLEINLCRVPSQLEMAAPYIIQAMKNTNLRKLALAGFTTTDHTAKLALVAILEALKGNSSLVSFIYSEDSLGERARVEGFQWSLYQEKLLEVLQKDNTTLAKLILVGVPGEDEPPPSLHEEQDKLRYYINLNRHGRRAARDHQTGMNHFVGLLSSVGEDNAPDDSSDDSSRFHEDEETTLLRNFNTMYGLLRELPGTWSIHALQSAGRKRKRDV